MHEREMTRQQRLSYEKMLYRYTTALEDGNMDGIIAVLNEAENDPRLEQMIMETHEAYLQQEQNTPSQPPQLNRSTNPHSGIRKYQSRPTRPYHFAPLQVAAAVFFTAVLIGSAIFLFNLRTSSNIGQTGTKITSTSDNIVVIYKSGITDNVIAQRADTGQTIWHYSLGPNKTQNVAAALLIQNHVVYIVHNKQIQALQARNGTLLWSWQTQEGADLVAIDSRIRPQLIVEHDRLYESGYIGGKLHVLNAKSGTMLWQYDSTQSVLAPLLAVHNDVAYVLIRGDDNHNGVKALQGADGTEIWSSQTMEMPFSVASTDNTLYVEMQTSKNASLPYTLFAIDNSNGQYIWSTAMPGSGWGPLIFTHGSVIVFDGKNFCAYNNNNGTQKWCTKNKPDANIMGNTTNIRAINGVIYGAYETFTGKPGDSDSYYDTTIQSINPDNGNILWSRHTQTRPDFTSVGDSLIFFTSDSLQSLSLKDGHTGWQNKYNDRGVVCIATGSL